MKTALSVSISLFLLFSLMSCDEEEMAGITRDIEVTITNVETYEYDLMISGDEEGAVIVTQAQHFQKSELVRDMSTNWSVVYRYMPMEDFTGTDFVDIETCTGGTGTGCSDIDIFRISFAITN